MTNKAEVSSLLLLKYLEKIWKILDFLVKLGYNINVNTKRDSKSGNKSHS